MAERTVIEQLNDAVEALLAGAEPVPGSGGEELDALVGVASALRGLPDEEFRSRLKEELMRPMADTSEETAEISAPGVPPGFHAITPYLSVRAASRLVEFVKEAFGATELLRTTGSKGGLHAEVRIGDSRVMIGGDAPGPHVESPCSLHLYVPDADAVYWRALDAGATSLEEPVDQPYGDREAGVRDPSGNPWWIATHKAGPSFHPEGFHSVTPYLHVRGAGEVIDFMVRALGAVELSRTQSPDGVIRHATVRIADSIIEMGEAQGEFQPLPSAFYCYVPDVDAAHRRAVSAGADSIAAPSDQAFGDRLATVKDPFGNSWYLAAPIKDTTL